MNADSIRQYLASHLHLQPGTKIQYGHPSPRFWDPLQLSVEEIVGVRQKGRKLFLYLHIPFCPKTDPPACGFCLFAREDYTGYPAVEQYLQYLKRELDMYSPRFDGEEIDCVYFGGGTPNMLKPADYPRVMTWVRDRFNLTPGVEVTLEGVPQLFDDARLEAMAGAGVTRVSIGAQQLKDELLKYSGRKQTAAQVLTGIERAHSLGMVVNVDLVCGWFDQQEQDLEDDLRELVPLAPESIVIHPLTLAGHSHFAENGARLPSPRDTCAAFLRGTRYLEEHGYWASSTVDFMLKDPPRGPEEVRYLHHYRAILQYDRLGIGYGANSLFAGTLESPGMTWRNIDSTRGYYDEIDAGRIPVQQGFGFTAADLKLLYVLKGLEGTPFLNAHEYAKTFGRSLAEDFEPVWTVMSEVGWLDVEPNGDYRPKGDGIFFLSTMQRCIANDRNDELRKTRSRLRLPIIASSEAYV